MNANEEMIARGFDCQVESHQKDLLQAQTQAQEAEAWIPVRNGDIYCSPACGAGCKLAAFEQATSKAKYLIGILGDEWESIVWENFGWHCRAVKKDGKKAKCIVEIHLVGNEKWIASVRGLNANAAIPQFMVYGENPLRVLEKLQENIDRHIQDMLAVQAFTKSKKG
jgi:hypothetical protein